jgi:heptosyltransferase I
VQTHLSRDPSSTRLLIVRVGAMGDVLHAMPAVAALRAMRPEWRIGWAIEPRWLPLLQADSGVSGPLARGPAMPLVDRTYFASTRAWKQRPFSWETLQGIASLRRELRGERFDLCVDMQGSIRSAVIGRMADAKSFVGSRHPREAPARWLYGQQIGMNATHVVDQGCELLGAAVGEVLRPAKVELPIDELAEISCDTLLTRILPDGGDFVIVAPTAGWGAKQWPAERYGAVAAELTRAGYRVLVNASSLDDPAAGTTVRASGGLAIAVPCSMAEMIALTRRASLVIAGDTGPLHLAAALEIPVVGLFGPTDPARNGPYATPSRVLRHPSSERDHSRRSETEQGLIQITVAEVVAAALELLGSEKNKEKGKVER